MLVERKILNVGDINESLLFDEFSLLRKFYQNKKDTFEVKSVSERWVDLFEGKSEAFCSELLKICYVFFAIPAHNANAERVFSFMNLQWSDERNRLGVSTVRAMLMTQYNLCKKYDCEDFYNLVVENKELLKLSMLSEKYNF